MDELIRERHISRAKKELHEIIKEARLQNVKKVVNLASEKLTKCEEIEKVILEEGFKDRLVKIDALIREKRFKNAIKELNTIIEDAIPHRLSAVVNEAKQKLNACQELEKKKTILEENFPTVEELIQAKDFSRAIAELEGIRSPARQYNFKEILAWTDEKMRLCSYLLVKTTVLELGSKFSRIQTVEITEKTGIKDETLIIGVIQSMIKNQEIDAEYFSSTRSIVFNQLTNIDEIDALMSAYKEWEDKGEGKIDKKALQKDKELPEDFSESFKRFEKSFKTAPTTVETREKSASKEFIYCRACGIQNKRGHKFCVNCGELLHEK